jgi:hypothetical protein
MSPRLTSRLSSWSRLAARWRGRRYPDSPLFRNPGASPSTARSGGASAGAGGSARSGGASAGAGGPARSGGAAGCSGSTAPCRTARAPGSPIGRSPASPPLQPVANQGTVISASTQPIGRSIRRFLIDQDTSARLGFPFASSGDAVDHRRSHWRHVARHRCEAPQAGLSSCP